MNLSFTTKSKYFKLVVPAEFVSTITGSQPLPQAPISRILYSPPATVVFWSDGTKTVAKCAPHERFDREKGLAICCAKKLLGAEYADAFKEFREPVNRVLTWNEVDALPFGSRVYVEDSSHYGDGVHVVGFVRMGLRALREPSSPRFYPILPHAHSCEYRAWLLPRKPTAAELAANPWPKREKCE